MHALSLRRRLIDELYTDLSIVIFFGVEAGWKISMKPFHTYFSLLRDSDVGIFIAALWLFGLGALACMMFTGAPEFLLDHAKIINYMCCLLGAILVGYTVVVGMMEGPEKTVTVEVEKDTAETVEKRYLKI